MAEITFKSDPLGPGNKRIIVCLDGTWNEPEEASESASEKQMPTNVLRFVRSVEPRDKNGHAQVIYYDTGVGTSSGADKFIGGGLGSGISLNIQEAYRFIANNYLDGDHIYLLGFSRGSYTARSLGGFIGAVGLLQKWHLGLVAEAYDYYRTPLDERADSEYAPLLTSLHPQPRKNIPIEFIGVWDTVGALGAPTPILGRLTKPFVGFHDTELGDDVRHAYHALAIDEQRRPFQPDLWTARGQNTKTLQQIWFTGVHSNIGGGYPNQDLSMITLNWMMHRAQEHRLEFTQFAKDNYLGLTESQLRDKAQQGLHMDSYSMGYKALILTGLTSYTREIGPNQHDDIRKANVDTGDERIHRSALDRFGREAPFDEVDELEAYEPENLAEAKNSLPVFEYDHG